MDQKGNKEEQFQAVIDGTENTKPKKKKEGKKGLKYELLNLAKIFVIYFICIFLLTNFVVKPVCMDGRDMDPAPEDGEINLMDIFSVKFQDIERSDVVIAYDEGKKGNWVKRVIDLPDDTIYARDDAVYVNGMPIEEPYPDDAYANQIRKHGNNFIEDFPKRTLEGNEYFPMGDNRIVSYDSRRVGLFRREDIWGKDVYILFSFNKIKMARNGGAE